ARSPVPSGRTVRRCTFGSRLRTESRRTQGASRSPLRKTDRGRTGSGPGSDHVTQKTSPRRVPYRAQPGIWPGTGGPGRGRRTVRGFGEGHLPCQSAEIYAHLAVFTRLGHPTLKYRHIFSLLVGEFGLCRQNWSHLARSIGPFGA